MNCTLAIIQLYPLNYNISCKLQKYHGNITPTYHRLKKLSRYVFCDRNYGKRYLPINIMMRLGKKLTSTPHVVNIKSQWLNLSYLSPYFKALLRCSRVLRNRISQSGHCYFINLRRFEVTFCSITLLYYTKRIAQYFVTVTLEYHTSMLFYNTKDNYYTIYTMLYFGILTSNPKTVFVTHRGDNRDSISSSTTLSEFVNLYYYLLNEST